MDLIWIVPLAAGLGLLLMIVNGQKQGARRDSARRNTQPPTVTIPPTREPRGRVDLPPDPYSFGALTEPDPDAFYNSESEMAVWGDEGTDDE
jgi:hypothetical protein